MKRLTVFLVAVAVLLSGCGKIDVTALLDREAPTRAPSVASSASARSAPEYAGPVVRLRVYDGDHPVGDLTDVNMANQLFSAAMDDAYLLAQEPNAEFNRKVEMLDDKDTVLAQVTVAAGGLPYAIRADGQIMMVPQYVYYGLESALWNVQSSFYTRTFEFDPDKDSDAVIQMLMQYQIPPLIRQRFGYADGYFGQWEFFGLEADKEHLIAYVQMCYATYTLQEEAFSPTRKGVVALRLTYDRVSGNTWQLGAAKFSEDGVDGDQVKSAVRSVLPFEYTQRYMQSVKDVSALEADVLMQAKEYLRLRGLGRLNLEK